MFFHSLIFEPETGCSTLSFARANFRWRSFARTYTSHSFLRIIFKTLFIHRFGVGAFRVMHTHFSLGGTFSVACDSRSFRYTKPFCYFVPSCLSPFHLVRFVRAQGAYHHSIRILSIKLDELNWVCVCVGTAWLYLFAHCKLFVPMSSFPFDLIQFEGMCCAHSAVLCFSSFFIRHHFPYAWNGKAIEHSDDDDFSHIAQ